MNKKYKIAFIILLLIWCLGFFSEFLVRSFSNLLYAIPFLKENYSFVCHQEKGKLIACCGYESLVCSRCAGIYIGALIASVFNLFRRERLEIGLKILVLSSIPMIIDVICYTTGLYKYSKTGAFLTGFLFGIVSFLYFYSAFIELINELREKRN